MSWLGGSRRTSERFRAAFPGGWSSAWRSKGFPQTRPSLCCLACSTSTEPHASSVLRLRANALKRQPAFQRLVGPERLGDLGEALAREFATNEIAPRAAEWNAANHVPLDILRRLGDLGLAAGQGFEVRGQEVGVSGVQLPQYRQYGLVRQQRLPWRLDPPRRGAFQFAAELLAACGPGLKQLRARTEQANSSGQAA